ncbi:uncharacterized protein TrAtP1_010756 [Trichoderma atroviride]|uniref:uncharacterized protein n=1 Tax=Hypocrea atroviridis TaxID=63577 RepID=UPI003332A8BB|nr:hypothetical protein TrAtP1_010756 [Trichoderma atroviride]
MHQRTKAWGPQELDLYVSGPSPTGLSQRKCRQKSLLDLQRLRRVEFKGSFTLVQPTRRKKRTVSTALPEVAADRGLPPSAYITPEQEQSTAVLLLSHKPYSGSCHSHRGPGHF